VETYYKLYTETFVAARKEIGREVNAEKTKYIFMFHEDNAEKNHNTKI
jgi:hypothetical protein